MNYSIAERLLNKNLMTILRKFLFCNYEELIELAIWALANIFGEGEQVLDQYCDSSIFERVFSFIISAKRKGSSFLLIGNIVKYPLNDSCMETAEKVVTYLCNYFPLLSDETLEDLHSVVHILNKLTEQEVSIIEYIRGNNLLKPFFDKFMYIFFKLG